MRCYDFDIINMAAADPDRHVNAVRSRSYQDESYPHWLLRAQGDLQNDGAYQDVILEVEDRRFPCHRLVLSAASDYLYFRALFRSDMAESRQKTVVLQGLDAGTFEEILSYIYSGTLHVSLDRLHSLYQAADYLQLDSVKDICSSYMAMNVERSTCVDLYKIADAFSVDSVVETCLMCIDKNFSEVASSEEFCSLSVNQLTEIISHDELEVKEEIEVWEAVVRWVQHSRGDRLHHLPSILSHIRFNLLTSDDTAAILDHPLVREYPGSLEIIRNVVQKGNSGLKPRFGAGAEKMALFFVDSKMQGINPRSGKFVSCSFTEFHSVVGATVTGDEQIFILAAREGEERLSLLLYNQMKGVWEQKSSVERLPEIDGDTFLLYIDGHLYYLASTISTIEKTVRLKKYDIDTNEWQDCAQLRVKMMMSMPKAVSCGFLYLCTRAEMYCYNPRENRWSELTRPIIDAEFWTSAVMGTEIFYSNMDFTFMLVYDTVAARWKELRLEAPSLQSPPDAEDADRHACSPTLFVHENELHAYMGCDQYEESKCQHVLVYDRPAGVCREVDVTLPDDLDWQSCHHVVARVYLPGVQDTCADTPDTPSTAGAGV
ncbi:kelch repeat and BTB domain-containing protein 2-like [Branchiostoma floridae x Branchiostoma japonicum]